MNHVPRRNFLKIASSSAAASVLTCSCASRPATVPSSAAISPGPQVQTKAEAALPIVLLPDKVAYVCGCKPDEHNPSGGGASALFIGNYCKHSEGTCSAVFASIQMPEGMRPKLTLI